MGVLRRGVLHRRHPAAVPAAHRTGCARGYPLRGDEAEEGELRAARAGVTVITDEDVDDEVADFLIALGYRVLLVRDHFPTGTHDYVIARAASVQSALVVTWNQRHFLGLAKRRRKNGDLSYPGMSVISFVCIHPRGIGRLRTLINDIEDIYQNRVVEGGWRMITQIGDTVLRFEDPEEPQRPRTRGSAR